MTETLEEIPTMTATERLIELLRSEERSSWNKADATFEAVNEHGARAVLPDEGTANTGLYQRIEEVWGELFDAHVPEQPDRNTVSRWYATARTWPAETRVEGASYRAHVELAGKDWRNRQGILSKLVAQKRKRHDETATVNGDDVRLWKQSQTPTPEATPWEEKFWSRLDSFVHGRTGPQTKTEWQTAIALVTRMLDDMKQEAADAE